jgi:hypothetical protein
MGLISYSFIGLLFSLAYAFTGIERNLLYLHYSLNIAFILSCYRVTEKEVTFDGKLSCTKAIICEFDSVLSTPRSAKSFFLHKQSLTTKSRFYKPWGYITGNIFVNHL